ncbi:MAG: sugar ABC transporter permease, partial [Actinobacteria bacterium]|nr:sugar ABC transporter permease [Actinomycetota bacterium]
MALQTSRRVSTWIGGFLLVVPSIAAVAIFVYGMIAWTIRISMTDRISASVKEPKFVGLQNYTNLISDTRFTHAFENLIKFTFVFIVGTTIAGFIMALLLEKGIKGEGFFRSFYLYPLAISFIAMGTVWNWLLNSNVDADAGGLNLLLQKVGLGFLQNSWYLSESGAAYALALPAI